MKLRYGNFELANSALLEGAYGFTLNGQQINDRFDLVRADYASFHPRGNRSYALSFSVRPNKNSLRAAMRHVLQHFADLPEQADLLLEIGEGADTEWVKFTGACIDAVPAFIQGESPGFQYSFSLNGPPSFDEPPPDVTPPEDSMKHRVDDIPDEATTMDVVFTTPFSSTPNLSQPSVQIPTGGDDIRALVVADSITTTGFSVEFTGAIPGTGYKLSWQAFA